MKTMIVALVLGVTSLAWADPADDLRACSAQAETLVQQVNLVRQVRDYYEARLAEALMHLDVAKAELAKIKKPEEPK